MTRWEYNDAIVFSAENPQAFIQSMNQYGELGWEAVCLFHAQNGEGEEERRSLKRPIEA